MGIASLKGRENEGGGGGVFSQKCDSLLDGLFTIYVRGKGIFFKKKRNFRDFMKDGVVCKYCWVFFGNLGGFFVGLLCEHPIFYVHMYLADILYVKL